MSIPNEYMAWIIDRICNRKPESWREALTILEYPLARAGFERAMDGYSHGILSNNRIRNDYQHFKAWAGIK